MMISMNPYKSLEEKHFWKSAVASKNMFDIDDLWVPKFNIKPNEKVATFGSCFAQHFGRSLKDKGYLWLNTEAAPVGMQETSKKLLNYDVFTCRTGNIYTTSLLRQWTEWALGVTTSPDECWESDGAFIDPFRPVIEPNGFQSKDEMLLSRAQAIKSFKLAIEQAAVFVFTMGLTESWFNSKHGYEYPMCPGTAAGIYDESQHEFCDQNFQTVFQNLDASIKLIRQLNPKLRIILTVSPVPLTATNTNNHVLVATMHAKSLLRTVAGQLAALRYFVDYFPSYEIINAPPFKGAFFEPNQRSVNHSGVNFVMNSFFRGLANKFGSQTPQTSEAAATLNDDIACEEELLEAFGNR